MSLSVSAPMYTKADGQKKRTILGSLEEIRRRFVYSVIVFILASVLSIVFSSRILYFFTSLAPAGTKFVSIELTEMLDTYVHVCLYSGLALSTPFLVYQVVLFLRPVLNRKTNWSLQAMVLMVFMFFLVGVAYTSYILLPIGIKFVLGYGPDMGINPVIDIGGYVALMAKIYLVIGLAFELPMVVLILAKFGLVSYKWLVRKWRWGLLGSAIIAALITPTGNPFKDSLKDLLLMDFGFSVSGPVLGLYLVSIFLAWLVRKPAKAQVSN